MQGLTSAARQDRERATLAREVALYLEVVALIRAEVNPSFLVAPDAAPSLEDRLSYYSMRVDR